ncbi:MAG: hypothetical protein ACOYXB_17365 [Bacteroidota bacterium]
MFLKIVLVSVVLLSIAMLGMGITMLVKKNGKFPAFQVGHNANMRRMGITCVKHEEIKCFKKQLKEKDCLSCQHG